MLLVIRLRNDLYCIGWGVKLYSLILTVCTGYGFDGFLIHCIYVSNCKQNFAHTETHTRSLILCHLLFLVNVHNMIEFCIDLPVIICLR